MTFKRQRLLSGIVLLLLSVGLIGCDVSVTTVTPPASVPTQAANLPTQPSTIPELPTLPPPTQPSTIPELPTLPPPTQPSTLPELPTSTAPSVGHTPLQQGFGAQKGFWQVYFTAPTGSGNRANYVGGIDNQLADAINQVQRTLDIAAFEFNDPVITAAVLAAHQRGVTVRMVVDDENGIKNNDTTLGQLTAVGIPIIPDNRPALMHNKFMIMDSITVWTGSYNYTINDTYRNNNNLLSFRSQKMVQNFQNEFNKMFEQKKFGPSKPSNTPFSSFTQDGTPIQVLFAPEDRVVAAMAVALSSATTSIRFMAFSFTLDDIAGVMQLKAQQGVNIQGIFETTGSETASSELKPLFCSGLTVRQDGNPFVLHHKVFIIDDKTVIAGSFNYSTSARDANDENMIIITDPDLALQYIEEFNRRWAEAKLPTKIKCS
jgi:phosphatidylserine/phosphatidylglycerophosphate/cardiolipin synthase-like enzyme